MADDAPFYDDSLRTSAGEADRSRIRDRAGTLGGDAGRRRERTRLSARRRRRSERRLPASSEPTAMRSRQCLAGPPAGGRGRARRETDVLNDRQARFVAEYLVDLNATQAAIRAGYSRQDRPLGRRAAVEEC